MTAESRSYAPARVAASTSTRFLEEGASATRASARRRWTKEETWERSASGPRFRFPPPDQSLLDRLVADYTDITRDPVRTEPKRNLVATCYRVHGDDFLPLVGRLFARNGTATNLLGEIRCLKPAEAADVPEVPLDEEWDAWAELEKLDR